mmetsp:Transcript_7831/g.28604  ORF Transcript_7831/g.28604 Transcript_7831/m.28604 type:complete len:225 (-) Transcript_7831:885-1559(-)
MTPVAARGSAACATTSDAASRVTPSAVIRVATADEFRAMNTAVSSARRAMRRAAASGCAQMTCTSFPKSLPTPAAPGAPASASTAARTVASNARNVASLVPTCAERFNKTFGSALFASGGTTRSRRTSVARFARFTSACGVVRDNATRSMNRLLSRPLPSRPPPPAPLAGPKPSIERSCRVKFAAACAASSSSSSSISFCSCSAAAAAAACAARALALWRYRAA